MTPLAMLLCALAAPLAASELRFDQGNADLEFTGSYDGQELPGRFTRFQGLVRLDAETPEQSRFEAEVEVASLDTDYEDRDEILRGPDWFDATSHPRARWRSEGDCIAFGASLRCPGTLSLRGVEASVALGILPGEGAALLRGEARINRRDFGVGQGEWDDPKMIGDEVVVRFTIRRP